MYVCCFCMCSNLYLSLFSGFSLVIMVQNMNIRLLIGYVDLRSICKQTLTHDHDPLIMIHDKIKQARIVKSNKLLKKTVYMQIFSFLFFSGMWDRSKSLIPDLTWKDMQMHFQDSVTLLSLHKYIHTVSALGVKLELPVLFFMVVGT